MNAKEFFQLENAFDRAEAQLPWIADMAVAQAAASPERRRPKAETQVL